MLRFMLCEVQNSYRLCKHWLGIEGGVSQL